MTWDRSQPVGDDEIAFEVRTESDGAWSDWRTLEYHDEHGPDPDSPEALIARPGTDEMIVGAVDAVQVKVVSQTGAVPADMKLAVVEPGQEEAPRLEKPAIDTAELDGAGATGAPATDGTGTDDTTGSAPQGAIELQAAAYTPRPTIYSRAQWGADERLRNKASLSYYEVHAGFVHHTVNANGYSRAEVPGILRSIYAYHTKSRGWSDIGYNFLVDRFGRIWEGRAGGVDRPVVGAHTLGYNDYAFAMSAIGNFDVKKPGKRIVQAYGALFAWKLSLHGVDAASGSQRVGPRSFPAINGHRDAGSTACPGRYLYAKLAKIRRLAAGAQVGWTGRELESDLAGSPAPDLVLRRASDKRGIVVPLKLRRDGRVKAKMGKAIDTGQSFADVNQVMNGGDWNRDGHGDVVGRRASDGALLLWLGDGTGRLGRPTVIGTGFAKVKLLAAVGDMTGDGLPDIMGQTDGVMRIWPGRGVGSVGASFAAHSKIKGKRQVGIGRFDTDGAPDTILRRGAALKVYAGNGPGGLTTERAIGGVSLAGHDWLIGVSGVGLTGRPGLVTRKRATGELFWMPTTGSGVGAPQPIGKRGLLYDLAG